MHEGKYLLKNIQFTYIELCLPWYVNRFPCAWHRFKMHFSKGILLMATAALTPAKAQSQCRMQVFDVKRAHENAESDKKEKLRNSIKCLYGLKAYCMLNTDMHECQNQWIFCVLQRVLLLLMMMMCLEFLGPRGVKRKYVELKRPVVVFASILFFFFGTFTKPFQKAFIHKPEMHSDNT